MEKGHLQSKCMHHLYEFEMLFLVILFNCMQKRNLASQARKTLRVGQDVTPKRELDRKSADKLHPLQTYTVLVQYCCAQNNNLTVNHQLIVPTLGTERHKSGSIPSACHNAIVLIQKGCKLLFTLLFLVILSDRPFSSVLNHAKNEKRNRDNEAQRWCVYFMIMENGEQSFGK